MVVTSRFSKSDLFKLEQVCVETTFDFKTFDIYWNCDNMNDNLKRETYYDVNRFIQKLSS